MNWMSKHFFSNMEGSVKVKTYSAVIFHRHQTKMRHLINLLWVQLQPWNVCFAIFFFGKSMISSSEPFRLSGLRSMTSYVIGVEPFIGQHEFYFKPKTYL